jgi:signal transduction histidine kinase
MRSRLWTRLLVSYLVVIGVGSATVFVAVGFVAPGAFEAAMGNAMTGMAGMDAMMRTLVQGAFRDAVQTALVIAVLAAAAAALIVSVALSKRISRPITDLATATRRIASGHYAERVRPASDDELGDLATSFNSMAASLEATERRRLELVGDVAHELRTPLATLDGYLEGLEDGVVQPSEDTWKLLRTETSRLGRLINDLQALWRAEARQLPLRLATVDVAGQMQAARGRFAASATVSRLALELAPMDGPLQVIADPDRLGQILDGFVSNAIRYSPGGTLVSIEAGVAGGTVTIGVTDQGPGLTAEQLDHVFERFYRVDPSRSRALGGAGIGLAISRALAEAMGGTVTATSPGVGRGSTFSISLPAA